MKSHRVAVFAVGIFALIMLLSQLGQSQGTPNLPLSQWYVQVVNNTCKEDTSCTQCVPGSGTVCSSDFQVPVSGGYNLYGNVKPPAGWPCGHCQACVKLYQGGSLLQHIETPCGGQGSCASEIDNISLSTGVTYTLCVCLIPCNREGQHTCQTCGQGYEAIGCITQTFGGGGCN
jgi:hypothetical protein